MTTTNRKKESHRKIIKFRTDNKIDKCCRCGKKLGDTMHHFLCQSCWDIQQNFPKFDRPKYTKEN